MKKRIVTVVLFTISVAINALQFRRIMALQGQLEIRPSRGTLSLGTRLRGFSVRDIKGQDVSLQFESTPLPTVLYIFRPSCVWCIRNSETVARLARGISGRYRIIGLSLSSDGLTDFIGERKPPFPIYTDPPDTVVRELGLGTTPETIVVSNTASVLADWTGSYSGPLKQIAENFFSVRLSE